MITDWADLFTGLPKPSLGHEIEEDHGNTQG